MIIVTPHKLLSAIVFAVASTFCVAFSAHAADTLTDAISLHQKGVSDDVLMAWAAQQVPVADTADNRAKLDDAKIAKPVVDALLVGNTKPKVAAAAPKKEGVPIADDTVIGLRGNGNPIAPPPLPPNPPVPPAPPGPELTNSYPPSTVVIDGWNVYNYDPFHTVVYGWPFVHNIYPYHLERDYGYSYGSAYRDNEGFRWQNQIPPNLQQPRNPETTIANRPHWPQNSNSNRNDVLTPSRPTHTPRDTYSPPPAIVQTPPPAGIVTHETNTGVKYITQQPQTSQTQPQQQAQAPKYYVPPTNNTPAYTPPPQPNFRR